ncbi:hypothetical protein [Spirosoma endbachense]|uniref:DUF4843 domain-containing protein n=1 Tax=Spirosoma endbachense TaxID=2666025 RepID=A0A6P1W4F9_9BACT|nr:hypothetical protein [Spirosoma endbachense]QHV99458.1 hypothetical protein GJR95_32565 [Spirosoma endbachense]
MKNIIINLLLLALVAGSSFSCKDDQVYSDLVRDNRPAVPVTFPGATTYGFNPYITSSLAAGGAIQFTLSIPATSGRTIKEITKVVGGATGINVATLNAATATTAYNPAPIAGSGTTAVFTTTIADFKKKYPTVPTTPATQANTFTEIQFLFLVTLDDGTQIVPEPVRVRIVA